MDSFWLNSAFYQAYCSLGNTGKNPAVGCILVNNNKVVGVGSTSEMVDLMQKKMLLKWLVKK